MVSMQLAPAAMDAPQVCPSVKSDVFAPTNPMAVKASAEVPTFVRVTLFGALTEPTLRVPNATAVADSFTCVPVPVRGIVYGLPAALSTMVTEPLKGPDVSGRKVTEIVQVAPAANEVPQVWVWTKLPATAIDVIPNGPVPALRSVTIFAALVVLMSWTAKDSDAGERFTTPAETPVPLSAIRCGLPLALSVRVTVPVRLPRTVGRNETEIVQEAPAATELPQVWVTLKSPLATMLVSARVPVPVFESVTVLAALALFTI
jgi:hypothetical protein